MNTEHAKESLPEIRTGRLLLRPFRESDLDDLYAFLSQLKDDEFEGYPGVTRENCREHLQYRLGSDEFFAMELLEGGQVIGNIPCLRREYDAREVGFIVNRDFLRRGYAAEALGAVIGEMFRQGTRRVFAECDPRNERSWRLLESVSFRREAHFRENVFFRRDAQGRPIWKDTCVYAMLAWPASLSALLYSCKKGDVAEVHLQYPLCLEA